VFGNGFISRHQPGARIHHKQHHIGFFNRQQRLFRHTGFYAVFRTINTARIDTDKFTTFDFSTTVLTVTGQPRKIRYQRITGAC
jgi:hypothetical protein